jgi:hypothetical protein
MKLMQDADKFKGLTLFISVFIKVKYSVFKEALGLTSTVSKDLKLR